MSSLRFRPGVLALALACAMAAACTKSTDTGDTVPAKAGAVQPAGNGTPMNEADACNAIKTALDDERKKLACGTVAVTCPDAIRPAGALACLQYDQGTVDACKSVIAKYLACTDFDQHPCIVTALTGTTSPGCVAAGGSGGADGGAGAAGTGGTSGTGGTGGASGAGGSAGSAGTAGGGGSAGGAGAAGGSGSAGADAGTDAATD